jgi:hypothetical protein
MEESWTQVTMEQIETHFINLQVRTDGIPAHFIFNVDEMGHSDWADRQNRIVWITSEFGKSTISIPMARSGRRITLVACIALDGSYLKPMFVIPRKSPHHTSSKRVCSIFIVRTLVS